MEIIIKDKASVEQQRKWLDKFEKELYIPMFPNEDEREPFGQITERISERGYPCSLILLEIEGDDLIGGCVADYHPECKSVLQIYLVVAQQYRHRGCGRKLFENAIKHFDEAEHVFLEADNPEFVGEGESAMNPADRIKMYEKWGFEKVKIHYKQPPLSPDMNFEENLILMHRGAPLTKEALKEFLFWFYVGLGYEDSPVLQEMFNEINDSTRI